MMSGAAEQSIYCWSCGTRQPATFAFCSKCGARLSGPNSTESVPPLSARLPEPVPAPTVAISPPTNTGFEKHFPVEPTVELVAIQPASTELPEEEDRPTIASLANQRHLPGIYVPPDAVAPEPPPSAQTPPVEEQWVVAEKDEVPGILVAGMRIVGLLLFFGGVGIAFMMAMTNPTVRARDLFYVPLLVIGGAAIAIQPRILTDLVVFAKYRAEMSYQVAGVLVAIGAIVAGNLLQSTLFKSWERSSMIRAAAAASAAETKAAESLPPPVLTPAEESAMTNYLRELARRDEIRHQVMAKVRRAPGTTGTATGTTNPEPASGNATAPTGPSPEKTVLLQLVWIRSTPAPAHLKTLVTLYTELLANELAVSQTTKGVQKESEQQNRAYHELLKALAKESERLQKLYPSFPAREWGA